MAKFKYNALKEGNILVKGEVEAVDFRDARKKIRELGFIPTKVYSETLQEEKSVSEAFQSKIKKLSLNQKIQFTSELETMLSSGITMIEALNIIAANAPDIKIKTVCIELRNAINNGLTFSQALEKLYSNVFGYVYIGLVKSGEASGELEATLHRMLMILRKQDDIKQEIILVSIYPCILVVIMAAVFTVLYRYVFPKFWAFVADNGAEMPRAAQAFFDVLKFTNDYWWLILFALAALFGAVIILFKNETFKKQWDKFILKVPFLSNFIEYINLSNFMTVLNISYEAGIPLPTGMELAAKTIGNTHIKSKADNSAKLARNGNTLTDAFSFTGVMPSALIGMIAAGEKSGSLGKMMQDVCQAIDKRLSMAIEAMKNMLYPLVLVFAAIIVFFVVLGFYSAYFGMFGSLL